MTTLQTSATNRASTDFDDSDLVASRVDPPHLPDAKLTEADPNAPGTEPPVSERDADEHDAARIEAVASQLAESSVQHFHEQARQLSDHLRGFQRDLDQRESQINARVAELANEQRAVQLWLRERQQELDLREQRLVQQEEQVEQRATAVSAAAVAAEEDWKELERQLIQRGRELDRREVASDEKEEQIRSQSRALEKAQATFQHERRHAEQQLVFERQQFESRQREAYTLQERLLKNIQRHRENLEDEEHRQQMRIEELANRTRAEATSEREQTIREASDRIARRQRELDAAEAMLNDHLLHLERDREKLEHMWASVKQERVEQRQQMNDRRSKLEREMEERAKALDLRAQSIDKHRAALEKLRTDVTRMHRETLELRLATEQLWGQLAGNHAPAELTRSISVIRSQLSDHYRLDRQGIEKRKHELKALSTKLDKQQKRVRDQRRDMQQWVDRRHVEIEEQAARLVSREQQLDLQDREHQKASQNWAKERRELHQQIRQLMGQTQRESMSV